ncbi:23S rRNA (guanosine(2251)-2'-O)-methyltransferase RlmB [Leucothrix pacifica]|uniref:23S rRNA (guanosine-2'-O-)-methyltransferase RlmB n=1 Tax=Leucothrix pacifica TaxID=1247513 RepID=A0A317CHY9_9GAMM|nr:23S rRNA (guanosine(2251)-2'-O)-methyltransferase RlmB [Leucothrix pacifica]
MKTFLNGVHSVQNALEHDASNITQLWVAENKRNPRIDKLLARADKLGLHAQSTTPSALDRMTGSRKHQGIVAEYMAPDAANENDLVELITNATEPLLLLVLDGVTDPHNLGACLRTAEGAGVDAVIAPKDKSASLTPTARKVSSGAAERIPFVQVTNLARTLDLLKDSGVWITGTSDKATQTLYDCDFKGSSAIVMGAEGKGVRNLTEKSCDFLISIPMAGSVSSLNVSVATGVVLYEAVRQRQT